MSGTAQQKNRYRTRAVALVAGTLVLWISGCAREDSAPADAAAAADRGAELFSENCGVCHGPTGRGPALAGIKALSSSELRARIRNHPIAGQIPQRLPANELADVIEYLESD